MIHPDLQQFTTTPVLPVRAWRGTAGMSLLVTAMGALVGSTLATFLGTGLGWSWAEPVLAPMTALTAAVSVYAHYRHMPLDWLQARMARALVMTGGAMMLLSVAMTRPGMAAVALWFMTATTVIVTSLAAGAGASEEMDRGPLPGARRV